KNTTVKEGSKRKGKDRICSVQEGAYLSQK
ncbi:hypothetical protein Goari_011884, partial [Gossypium aridum]|nr:hypothetical protein [Gossypium aridum]